MADLPTKMRNCLDSPPSDEEQLIEDLTEEMAQRWRDGERPRVEDYLELYPQLRDQPEAALELLYEEIHLRQEQGEEIRAKEFLKRFPDWQQEVHALLECHHLLAQQLAGPLFPTVGETLGEFRLLAELGGGAASRVFLAAQPSLANRPVVLKLGPHGGCEHLSLARLQHTHIVPLHSAHDFPARLLRALCLPYFGGTTLDRLLDALRDRPPSQRSGRDLIDALQNGERWADAGRSPNKLADFLGRLSYVQTVCWIAACLCDGLHYAHERGLLHLDLKPSNILLAADGQPMLLDFHLARPPVPAGAVAPVWMGGTPAYMPPEQRAALEAVLRREKVPEAVDVRADLFSLGVLLYELLGGRLPSEPAATAGHVQPSARSLRRLNPCVTVGLADVVARCLSRDPERRYSSAADLATDLRRHLADLPLHGVANRSWSERWRKWQRRRRHALPLLILSLTVTAASAFALVHASRQSHKAQIALHDGQDYLAQRRYAEALNAFKHGIALVEDLPFGSDLKQHLHDRLREAECGQAIHELHLFRQRVRPLYNDASLPEAQARTVESHCRAIWQQREAILERLQPRPDSDLERQFRTDLLTDLLDVAIFAANLRVRLAAPNEAAAARRQALKILDEAEALFGPSRELRRERQSLAQALNKQS